MIINTKNKIFLKFGVAGHITLTHGAVATSPIADDLL